MHRPPAPSLLTRLRASSAPRSYSHVLRRHPEHRSPRTTPSPDTSSSRTPSASRRSRHEPHRGDIVSRTATLASPPIGTSPRARAGTSPSSREVPTKPYAHATAPARTTSGAHTVSARGAGADERGKQREDPGFARRRPVNLRSHATRSVKRLWQSRPMGRRARALGGPASQGPAARRPPLPGPTTLAPRLASTPSFLPSKQRLASTPSFLPSTQRLASTPSFLPSKQRLPSTRSFRPAAQ